jgi:hypothetical protein
MAAESKKEQPRPASDWHEEFCSTGAAVRALFTKNTYQTFRELEKKIDPDLGDVGPYPSVHAFIEARDATINALYNEVI